MSIHWSSSVGRPMQNPAPEGWDDADWHVDAAGDTGTSYMRVGRPYVIACEWCRDLFIAESYAKALAMFREHEDERAQTSFEADRSRQSSS